MKTFIPKLLLTISLLILCGLWSVYAQGFLQADGKKIVNDTGENIILRGIGTGNWMLQEGYMMNSANAAGTQHEFRAKLVESMGEDLTEQFYESWLANHFQKVDVDSMAAWGFNSIRVALHYKWFTLPIEDEPIEGQQTWIDKGFVMIDSLIAWCAENQMYLILDLHGAPGGQGKDAAISDYDDSKPSLWESELNKDKTVALWRKIAERYHNEIWIGGYDLINEVNWSFPENNNSQLRELYIRITNAIREFDQNHLIFIEGNGYANDFNDMTPPWDPNMAYSFHKYWTYNEENSLDWVLSLRDQYNVPLWLGESGENSNTWFTDLVKLAESNNIGWSWWPVKKTGINNILKVNTNPAYEQLISAWENDQILSSDFTYSAVMQFSENHRFENCEIRYDVIDALIRQPQTTDTKPFKAHTTNQTIYAVDYDLGQNNEAYFDLGTADYHLETDKFEAWNNGWEYRNDGVDIEICEDPEESNGYQVGWIESTEWLQYTLSVEKEAAYSISLRTASKESWDMHIKVNSIFASETYSFRASGSLNDWRSDSISGIILPAGEVQVQIYFDSDGPNFNHFHLTNPQAVSSIPFQILSAITDNVTDSIYLNLNKSITSDSEMINESHFQLIANNRLGSIKEIVFPPNNPNQIILVSDNNLFANDKLRVSYLGDIVLHDNQQLENFSGQVVKNKLLPHSELPGLIQAEDYFVNEGFRLENCTDTGSGQNIAYADEGDYVDYLVNFTESGDYKVDFRVAAAYGSPDIILMKLLESKMTPFKVVKFNSTGGWQSWQTQSTIANFDKGKTIFRIYARNGEFNLNWFSFGLNTSQDKIELKSTTRLFPNPASDSIRIEFGTSEYRILRLINLQGKTLIQRESSEKNLVLDTSEIPSGSYILYSQGKEICESLKLIIAR